MQDLAGGFLNEREFLNQLHHDLCEVFDIISGVEPEPHPGGLKDYIDQIIRQIEARRSSLE